MMKMEIRSLRAINCGPFRDVCIDFCDPSGKPQSITILAGANGSGKTTVLELIVALSTMISSDPISLYAMRKSRKILEIEGQGGYVQMDWLIDNKNVSFFYGTPPSDTKLASHSYGVNKSHGGLYEMEGSVVPEIREMLANQNKQTVPFSDVEKVQSDMRLPSILYFPHNRSLLPIRGETVHREEIKYQWLHSYETVHSFEGSLDSYLIWLDYAEPDTFEQVIKFLNSLDFDGKTFSVQRKELKAVVTTRDGQTHYLEDLSSGEQNILIMLLELRRRLLPHSIVLIDEIENSLHPAFQYRLARALQRMQAEIPFQLIVTTHAPAFLEIFGPESARILTEF